MKPDFFSIIALLVALGQLILDIIEIIWSYRDNSDHKKKK